MTGQTAADAGRQHAPAPGDNPPVAGSSFYTALRILPKPQREAMFALYGFCRAVDDVADEDGARDWKRAELDAWRRDVVALYAGATPARLADLAGPVRAFGLRQADFQAVIDGMAMDAAGDIRGPDWETLDLYCDRVASAVGRLSVRIFGVPDAICDRLAHHLGRALQLTNILRDIDEDARIGRLYLPREALDAAGIVAADPVAAAADPRLASVCAAVASRAESHFDAADAAMAEAPRRTVKAPRLMAAAYRSTLAGMIARGFAPPRLRVRTDRLRLIGALLRYGIF